MLIVADPDKMDDETFQLHFTKRHADSLAGQKSLAGCSNAVVEGYRAFHRTLHRLKRYKHTHASYAGR